MTAQQRADAVDEQASTSEQRQGAVNEQESPVQQETCVETDDESPAQHNTDAATRHESTSQHKADARTELCTGKWMASTSQHKAPVPESLCALRFSDGVGDLEIARLARLQHGLVHRRQLLAAGLTQTQISWRLRTRRLTAVCWHVYAPGDQPPNSPQSKEMMAVLRFLGYGVLSGLTAARIWEITDLAPEAVQLTLIRCTTGSAPPGVKLTRVPAMHESEMRFRKGFPVTSVARTWVDMAGECSREECGSALAIIRRRGLCRDRQIEDVIARAPANKAGIRMARELLADPNPGQESRSVRERKLLALVAAAGMPPPEMNVTVAGHLVDFYWPEDQLVVEFDSWEFHQDRESFENDRKRDQDLTAAGMRVQRITSRHMDDRPFEVVACLASARSHGHVARGRGEE